MPSFSASQLWPVLTALCQRGESWAFVRTLSTSLSFSPFPSSHHTETSEQAAGPSRCDNLAGVTVSAGRECSARRVGAVPFFCYSLVGAPHCFWLMVGCLAHILSWPVGSLVCVPGGVSSSLVWVWVILIPLISLFISLQAWGTSRAFCS